MFGWAPMTTTAAHFEVVVMDRGGFNPRRLAVAEPSASWEIGGPGAFSAFARIADLRAVGLGGDLTGRWLEWDHPTAGRWGGVVTGRPVSDGVAEVAADGYAALLRGRVLAEQDRGVAGAGGGLARRAVIAAGRDEPTYVTIGTIGEGGEFVSLDTGGGDVAESILPGIAEAAGIEWRVDADRRFHASRKLGRDRSASVRLVEDRHVVGYRIDDDLWASSLGTVYAASPSVAPGGGASTPPLVPVVPPPVRPPTPPGTPGPGRVQRVNPYLRLVGEYLQRAGATNVRPYMAPPPAWATPQPAAYAAAPAVWPGEDAAPAWFATANAPAAAIPVGVGVNSPAVPGNRLAPPPTVPVEMQLADTDGCWAWFDLGDTVRIDLGSCGFAGRFRVLLRALDAASGTMTVAGEAMADQ